MTFALDASFGSISEPLDFEDASVSPRPNAPNRAQKADDMESISANRESKTASRESGVDSQRARLRAADEVLPIVEGWVEELAGLRRGYRTAAYDAVARLFDCSESWVRRMCSRQIGSFDADLYKRIISTEPDLKARRVARARAELAQLERDAEGPFRREQR